jgi:hypothetical protein
MAEGKREQATGTLKYLRSAIFIVYAIAATQKSPSGLETLNLLFLPLCHATCFNALNLQGRSGSSALYPLPTSNRAMIAHPDW